MWPINLNHLPAELIENTEVSDLMDLTRSTAADLERMADDVRPAVEDELAKLFRRVIEIAICCRSGCVELLDSTDLTVQLKALIACEEQGEVVARFEVAQFWVSRRPDVPKILITGVALLQ